MSFPALSSFKVSPGAARFEAWLGGLVDSCLWDEGHHELNTEAIEATKPETPPLVGP